MLDAIEPLLLSAVPSFGQPWIDEQAKYAGEPLSARDRAYELLSRLAGHLGAGRGSEHELASLLAALERVYERADDVVGAMLTVGFFEDLIVAASAVPGRVRALDAAAEAAGPRVRAGYDAARRYLRGPADAPDAPHWVRP